MVSPGTEREIIIFWLPRESMIKPRTEPRTSEH